MDKVIMQNGYTASVPVTNLINKDLNLHDADTTDLIKLRLRAADDGPIHKLNYLRMIRLHCDMLIDITVNKET